MWDRRLKALWQQCMWEMCLPPGLGLTIYQHTNLKSALHGVWRQKVLPVCWGRGRRCARPQSSCGCAVFLSVLLFREDWFGVQTCECVPGTATIVTWWGVRACMCVSWTRDCSDPNSDWIDRWRSCLCFRCVFYAIRANSREYKEKHWPQ